MKKIRVWVTCYNEEKNLERCLDSIGNQIVHGAEIVVMVSTNHSTDDSQKIINKLERVYRGELVIEHFEPIGPKLAGIEHMAFMWDRLNARIQDYTIHLGGHDYWTNSGVLDKLFQRAENFGPNPAAIVYPDVVQVDATDTVCGHYGDHFQTNGGVTALLAQQIIQTVNSPQFFGLWNDKIRRTIPIRHLCSGFDHLIVTEAALRGAILFEGSARLVMQAPPPGDNLQAYGQRHLTAETLTAGPQDYLNQLEWCLHLVDEGLKVVPEPARPLYKALLTGSMVATYVALRGMNLHIVPGAMDAFNGNEDVREIFNSLAYVEQRVRSLVGSQAAKGNEQ